MATGVSSSAPPTPSPPEVTPTDTAAYLIKHRGPLSLIHAKVESVLSHLQSITVDEVTRVNGRVFHRHFAVDALGNCSGTETLEGATWRFVIRDGTRLTTTAVGELGQRLRGRWIPGDADSHVAQLCEMGAGAVVDRQEPGQRTWLLEEGRVVGVERVGGRRALHVRQPFEAGMADIWVGPEEFRARYGPELVVLRLDVDAKAGGVFSVRYSRPDRSPVAKLPPPSMRVSRESVGLPRSHEG